MNESHGGDIYEYTLPAHRRCDMRTAAFASEVIRLLGEADGSDPSSVDIVSAQAEVAALNPRYSETSQAEAIAVVTRYFEGLRRRRAENSATQATEEIISLDVQTMSNAETIV